MRNHFGNTPRGRRTRAGFALVVTLSLMILLTVIAVGMLTLSSISLRSSQQGHAGAIARSNARLAVLLALGDLQRTLGRDQSASARASAVVDSTERPHLTGAWQSWRWAPTADGSPAYTEKKNRFSGWLVSTPNPAEAASLDFPKTAVAAGNDAVYLVGSPDLPLTDSQGKSTAVIARKVPLSASTRRGGFAWAVFDESAKAAIDLGDPEGVLAAETEVSTRTVPHRVRADALDPQFASLKTPVNFISLETASIPGGEPVRAGIRRRFHDLTTGTIGLLTDTAGGGLKTDLTSTFEPGTIPAGILPMASPYDTTRFPLGSGAVRWAYLRDHYRKYKTVRNAKSEPSYTPVAATDLKINRTGINNSPDIERLLPAIAKFQLVFSVVTHHSLNVGDRRAFLNNSGDPKGYQNYGVAHLAYDPVVTLYNPYDVALNLNRIRVRVWDPPVGFKFSKVDNRTGIRSPLRDPAQDGATDGFLGLARFQITNQSEPMARKCFTLVLTDGTPESAAGRLWLKPGEVKVFSPRVQTSWTWEWETAGGYDVKTFFDYDKGRNFANQDPRTGNRFGVEAVPGWDTRAGLQTDHLATSNPRYRPSKYAFELARDDGFATLRSDDSLVVEAKPIIASGNASRQFQVDVLAGINEGSPGSDLDGDLLNQGVMDDTLRSYKFNFNPGGGSMDLSGEISEDPSNPVVSREFMVGDVFHGGNTNLKKPFAMLEMSPRTAKDELNDSKPWLYNNFVVEGAEQNTSVVGLSQQSYDLRFMEMTSFRGFPKGIEIDPDTKRGYFGPRSSANEGSSFVQMNRVPLAPAASLGDLVGSNLAAGSLLPRVMHPFGNSRAHPLIPSSKVATGAGALMRMDHSYLLNDALWDSFYFSSITGYGGSTGGIVGEIRSLRDVLKGVLDGSKPALNSRLVPVISPGDATSAAADIAEWTDAERVRKLAAQLGVSGAFNVNSTSVDAWRAVLASQRDRVIHGMELKGATGSTLANRSYVNENATPFVRAGKPLAGADAPGFLRWAAFRSLTDAQITVLAERIVAEIRARGVMDGAPSLTLGEFVNRRVDAATSLHSLAGLLQSAIDKSGINEDSIQQDSKLLSYDSIPEKRRTGVLTPEAIDGQTAEGAPSMLTQGDLMAVIAPVATVRGDTFKIRAYGEAKSADGKTVVARAWCEAVVQRVPGFVDPSNPPGAATPSLTPVNQTFGRRFEMISFRWLDETEV